METLKRFYPCSLGDKTEEKLICSFTSHDKNPFFRRCSVAPETFSFQESGGGFN